MSKFEILAEALKTDPYVFIDIYDITHQDFIAKNLFGRDILAKHDTIKDYFSSLYHDKGVRQVQIQEYRKNGNSKRMTKPSFQINLESSNPVTQPQENMTVQNQVPTTPPLPPTQPHQAIVMPGTGLNGLGLTGLEAAKLLGAQERYDRLKVDYDALHNKLTKIENDKSQLETDLKAELRKIEIDLKDAQVKLATAEKSKELAVKEVKLDQKSFFDSELAKKLPDTLANFMPQQQQVVTEASQGLQGVEASEVKSNLIQLILSERFNDQMAQETIYAATGIYSNKEFTNELRELIKKYNLYAS